MIFFIIRIVFVNTHFFFPYSYVFFKTISGSPYLGYLLEWISKRGIWSSTEIAEKSTEFAFSFIGIPFKIFISLQWDLSFFKGKQCIVTSDKPCAWMSFLCLKVCLWLLSSTLIFVFFFLEKLKLSQFFMLLHFDRLVVINFLPVYV